MKEFADSSILKRDGVLDKRMVRSCKFSFFEICFATDRFIVFLLFVANRFCHVLENFFFSVFREFG